MKVKFPLKVLKPIQGYLQRQELKLKKRKEALEKEDPFKNVERLTDNAADAEAAEKEGHERVSILKREIEKNLIRVRKTLTRIKLGKYGLCARCGKMINTDRLAANPTAELCITCQAKAKEEKESI